VLESVPNYVNFPHDDEALPGQSVESSRSRTRRSPKPTVVLVIDSDVPWIPSSERAQQPARMSIVIDVDPLKQCRCRCGTFQGDRQSFRADAATALAAD
jgi:acetolactate synthase-1/2/3 large subunit